MPDSVEMPAPLSTSTPPSATIGTTSARVEVRGSDGPRFDQVRVGLVRTSPAYVPLSNLGLRRGDVPARRGRDQRELASWAASEQELVTLHGRGGRADH